MTKLRHAGAFIHNESAAITVEFVVVMLFFITITFFVLEVALAQFWWQTAEKAAQIGARLALVSDPAVTAISGSTTNPPLNGDFGLACPQNCDFSGFAGCSQTACTWTCTGGGVGCNSAAFTYIVNRMRQTYVPIQDSNVTISYRYAGLGYAGGPVTPVVTVTLSGVPLKLGFISIIGNIIGKSAAPLFQIPTMSATMTGEDLQSSSSS